MDRHSTVSPTAYRFREIVKGRNFMTPNVLGFYESENKRVVCELASGEFMDKPLYGVAVVVNKVHRTDLGQPFKTEAQAEAYIEMLLEDTDI